jgi:hypothetical protein
MHALNLIMCLPAFLNCVTNYKRFFLSVYSGDLVLVRDHPLFWSVFEWICAQSIEYWSLQI